MSMTRRCSRKKSDPKIGRLTSARRKMCTNLSPGKDSATDLFPKVFIEVPLAARRVVGLHCLGRHFLCAGDAGKTETSAPLSTKKDRFWRWQKTERAPSRVDAEESAEIFGETPGVTADSRPWRFPRQARQDWMAWASRRGSSCRRTEKGTCKSLCQNGRGWHR